MLARSDAGGNGSLAGIHPDAIRYITPDWARRPDGSIDYPLIRAARACGWQPTPAPPHLQPQPAPPRLSDDERARIAADIAADPHWWARLIHHALREGT